jgi:hypothetical protein
MAVLFLPPHLAFHVVSALSQYTPLFYGNKHFTNSTPLCNLTFAMVTAWELH